MKLQLDLYWHQKRTMRKNREDFPAIIIGFAALISLIYIILNFAPDKSFNILNFSFSPILIFLVLVFISIYELFSFTFNDQRQGFLVSFFATLYLILRLNRLIHPFFLILIVAIFITLELLFRKRK